MLEVGTVAAEFEGIAETWRRMCSPLRKRSGGREAIEGIIDLDRVEVRSIIGEPLFFRQVAGVKDVAPVVVLVAGGPYSQCSPFRVH